MKKILLVEDEKNLAKMYRDKFHQSGFVTFLSFNVMDGLRLAAKETPDLILLDIIFPKHDGIFFLERLRSNKKTSLITVVAFSNYDLPRLKEYAFELGVKDYLLKADYSPDEIVEKIKGYLK